MSVLSPGFRMVHVGDGGKAAFVKFMAAIAAAKDGDPYEVGISWSPERKWCVYQRSGDAVLMMSPEEARRIHRAYEKMCRRPEWRDVSDSPEIRDLFGALPDLAREAFHNNRDGVLPEGGANFIPRGGRA